MHPNDIKANYANQIYEAAQSEEFFYLIDFQQKRIRTKAKHAKVCIITTFQHLYISSITAKYLHY